MHTWHSEMSAMCFCRDSTGFAQKCVACRNTSYIFFYNELEFRAYIKYNISTKSW